MDYSNNGPSGVYPLSINTTNFGFHFFIILIEVLECLKQFKNCKNKSLFKLLSLKLNSPNLYFLIIDDREYLPTNIEFHFSLKI